MTLGKITNYYDKVGAVHILCHDRMKKGHSEFANIYDIKEKSVGLMVILLWFKYYL